MDNARLVTRFYDEAANAGRLEVIDEIFADDFVLHGRPGAEAARGPAPVRESVQTLRHAFAGLDFDIEDIVSTGDRVAARWTMRGKHVGDAFGNAASGRDVAQKGMVFYRVADGRLAEQWILVDVHGLLQQIEPA